MAKPNSKEFKRVKNIAEMLLNSEGVEHDEWLYEQYLKVQDKYSEIFEDALSFYLAHKKSDERKPFLGTQSTNSTED